MIDPGTSRGVGDRGGWRWELARRGLDWHPQGHPPTLNKRVMIIFFAMKNQTLNTMIVKHNGFCLRLFLNMWMPTKVAANLPKLEIGDFIKLCKHAGCESTAGATVILSHAYPRSE